MKLNKGDILIYLGGDTFLDGGLVAGNRYTISSILDQSYYIDEVTMCEVNAISFIETNLACHLNLVEKYFKLLLEEREIKLDHLLNK
jgi:hypothetical protein